MTVDELRRHLSYFPSTAKVVVFNDKGQPEGKVTPFNFQLVGLAGPGHRVSPGAPNCKEVFCEVTIPTVWRDQEDF